MRTSTVPTILEWGDGCARASDALVDAKQGLRSRGHGVGSALDRRGLGGQHGDGHDAERCDNRDDGSGTHGFSMTHAAEITCKTGGYDRLDSSGPRISSRRADTVASIVNWSPHPPHAGVGEREPVLPVGCELRERISDGYRIALRDEHSRPTCQELRDPTRVGGDNGDAGRHRLDQKHRNPFPALTRLDARKERDVPVTVPELVEELLVIDEAGEPDAVRDAECIRVALDRRLQRPVPRTLERHVHAGRLESGHGLQRVTMAFELVEPSCEQDAQRASRRRLPAPSRSRNGNAHVNEAHVVRAATREGRQLVRATDGRWRARTWPPAPSCRAGCSRRCPTDAP